jgi:hypothetical protein
MIGAIIITYFVADIVYQSNIRTLKEAHTIEIETIEERNINFTDHFVKSSVVLDSAREDRASGNYHFDLAFLWYNSALSEKNSSIMELYKNRAIDNCTNAMPNYLNSNNNFEEAKDFFNDTKAYTSYDKYIEILDLYVNLTGSGAKLAMLRYNASVYLKYLAENLTLINGTVTYLENVSELMDLFNETLDAYDEELEVYEEYKDAIDEYEFFEEIRE